MYSHMHDTRGSVRMARICCMLFLVSFICCPSPARAVTGVCENDDGNIAVSIMTNDEGQLLDLAVTVDDTQISRFPEANRSSITLPSYRYKFSAEKNAHQDALDLDISGDTGHMEYQGKTFNLECNWQ